MMLQAPLLFLYENSHGILIFVKATGIVKPAATPTPFEDSLIPPVCFGMMASTSSKGYNIITTGVYA